MHTTDEGQKLEQWRGKVAMVTGASSGIGRATARHLLAAGMKVAACARRVEAIEALGAEAGDGELFAGKVDLRSVGEIADFFNAVRERWGGVDVLINNAGLGFSDPLSSGDPERWKEMLDVNVLALCICTQEALKDMERRGGEGHVIHIGSMAGHRVPGGGFYAATKFAVRALTESLRQELRAADSPIRVSCISPGFVETGFAANYAQDDARAKEVYSRFECLQPKDIARAVIYALGQPPHVQVHDLLVRPTQQPS